MHIFLSYAKADTYNLAMQLDAELGALDGVTCWVDREMVPGKSWPAQIEEEIERADVMVVFLSSDVKRKPTTGKGRSFVIKEISFAQHLGIPIIPVMVQQIGLPIQIAEMQYIDFTYSSQLGKAELITHIWQLAGAHELEASTHEEESERQRLADEETEEELERQKLAEEDSVYQRPADEEDRLRRETKATTQPIVPIPVQPSSPPHVSPSAITPYSYRPSSYTPYSYIEDIQTPPLKRIWKDIQKVFSYVYSHILSHIVKGLVGLFVLTVMVIFLAISYNNRFKKGLVPISSNDDWQPIIQDFDGFDMALVPVGCFMMGSDNGANNEQPVHEICFEEPFFIDVYEVTNEQYGVASSDENCSVFSLDPNQPRNCVSWFDAHNFCEERDARLPTEAEWEYAARGPSSLIYPWGDEFDVTLLNCGSEDCLNNGYGGTSPTGSFPEGASWAGAMDMAGNVWEWTSTIYDTNLLAYPYVTDDGREDLSDTNYFRVQRGGSFGRYCVSCAGGGS